MSNFPWSVPEASRVSRLSPARSIPFSPYGNTKPLASSQLFHHRPTTISILDQYSEAATASEIDAAYEQASGHNNKTIRFINEISRCLQIYENNLGILERELKRKYPEKIVETCVKLVKTNRLLIISKSYEDVLNLTDDNIFVNRRYQPIQIMCHLKDIGLLRYAHIYFERNQDDHQFVVIHFQGSIYFKIPVKMDRLVFDNHRVLTRAAKVSSLLYDVYVLAPQVAEPYLKDRILPCFTVSSEEMRRAISECKSETGRIASKTNECSQNTVNAFDTFRQLRNQRRPILAEIRQKQKELANLRLDDFSAQIEKEKEINELHKRNENVLWKMIHNETLNCGEYAELALIIIRKSQCLENGYSAHVAHLKHPVSMPGIYHDHAFVLITDILDRKAYIVDLWQVTTYPRHKGFIGTIEDYVVFLNRHADGQYVRRELLPVTAEHICIDDSINSVYARYRVGESELPFMSDSDDGDSYMDVWNALFGN